MLENMDSLLNLFFVLVCLVSTVPAAQVQPCALKGPDYLAPRFPSKSIYVKRARAQIARAIAKAVKDDKSEFGSIDASTTSFSIGIYSVHEPRSLYTYNRDGPKLPKPTIGLTEVDSNTIYRIGSISKLLSVYLYLATDGDESFNSPITRYIPEFAEYVSQHSSKKGDDLSVWDFESMTVGALASQLSGLPRGTMGNFFVDEILDQLPLPKAPKIPGNITGANCPDSYHTPCTRATFLENIMLQKPVAPPFFRPTYSNTAYGVMGLVLEKITGQALPDLFKKNLVEALQLNATYYAAPPTPHDGIIPFNNSFSYWTANIGNTSAAGNYYSSVNDMERLGRSILTSKLLSPALTRRFLSPATFADRLRSAVGMPWEIFATWKDLLTKESWIYSKRGDIGTYSTITAVLPDWDMGLNVLTAGLGAGNTVQPLADILVEHMVPAFEKAAKEEARDTMAGKYSDTKTNSSIVLEVDDGPGIAITSWTAKGFDMMEIWAALLGSSDSTLRLYPSGLTMSNDSVIGFRAVAYNPAAKRDSGTLSLNCFEWTSVDAIDFGRFGLDEISIRVDPRTRRAVSVEPRAFGTALTRSKSCE